MGDLREAKEAKANPFGELRHIDCGRCGNRLSFLGFCCGDYYVDIFHDNQVEHGRSLFSAEHRKNTSQERACNSLNGQTPKIDEIDRHSGIK